ncbi:MAG: histidinol-phosphate transaminase [Gemmatimonadaceae bacterium]
MKSANAEVISGGLLLARDGYRDIALYTAPREPGVLDLSDNTNLWGTPPSSLRTLSSIHQEDASRYPVAYEPVLRDAIARYVDVPREMVVAGCGSDDVLDSAIRAFAEPGERLCLPAPSFGMIPVFARTNGLVPVEVPLTRELDAAVDDILATRARITYLCSPNNPTGGALSRSGVEQIVEGAAGLVIIDQAYVEFGGESFIDLLSSRRPVLVTRTMSKAFGLAGLRVGYGIGSPELISEVMKARGPYKVSTLSERAAIAALENDLSWVSARIGDVVTNRARFRHELSIRGITSLDSSANFVLIPVNNSEVSARRCRQAGIRVRALPSLPGIGDAIRIAIGPWELMQPCLDALGGDS